MRAMIFGAVVLILCLTKTQQLESTPKERAELEEKFKKIGDVSGPNETVETTDIIPSNSSGRHRRQAFRNDRAKWTNGVVEYTFAPNLPENVKNIFRKAAEAWSKSTCLDIHENANAKAKIMVAKGPGCMSSLGMQGNTQGLMLGDKCMTTELSELHAIVV
ncbi:hypothetical protein Y032_0256g379 [Ancylostoma ceylanicum]|uniref:Peptidase M12A domain-containing protein n=2 Tax=Ancylostoma ceylanicum TaxID=53326 RepID=A0A016SB49_9BILA|nr:hypothetical protein Y032_0256g379 [Ancylostoma ceylanicum]